MIADLDWQDEARCAEIGVGVNCALNPGDTVASIIPVSFAAVCMWIAGWWWL